MPSHNILKKIIVDKKQWIDKQKKIFSIENIIQHLEKSTKNFYNTLCTKKTSFILECKKASPTKGVIRKNFDPIAIGNIYKKYASVISVVTDEKYFQGNFKFLRQVSDVTHQPILCKDFIIDPWQIYLARLYKADAVLLMLSVIDDFTYVKLSNIAHTLNMGVLTEICDENEKKRAIALKAKIIGINNRNLNNLSINLENTTQLASNFPDNIKIISESGINHYRDIKKLRKYVHGFLIGTTLMQEENLEMAIRRVLLGENKVCGLTRTIDVKISYELGAIYGGLIFTSDSPRYIKLKDADYIASSDSLRYVGVFKNDSIKNIVFIASMLNLFAVQLHGNENQSYINKLRKILPKHCRIWKAIDMSFSNKINLNLTAVDFYLLDNGGGTGQTFDWNLIKQVQLNKVILAGGISLKNCENATYLGCAGLDLNSKFEVAPGIKDYKKLNKAFKIIQTYIF